MPTSQPSEIVSSVIAADPSSTAPLSADVIGGVVVLDQGSEKLRTFTDVLGRARYLATRFWFTTATVKLV